MKLTAVVLFLYASSALAEDALEWRSLPGLPDPLGVAGAFAGVTGGGLLVAGGAQFPRGMPWEGGAKVWTERVWFLESKDGSWRAAGSLPRPLAYGVSVTDQGKVWCVGGSDAARHYPDAFVLDWSGGGLVCERAPALPVPLANAAGAVDEEGTFYVACGSEAPGEAAASARVFSLRLRDKVPTWTELPPLPGAPRILPVAGCRGGVFYVFGGVALEPNGEKTIRRYLRDCWRYVPAGGWRRIADLPVPAAAAASPAPFVRGAFWVVAGDDGSLAGFQPVEEHPGFPGRVQRYDPEADAWRTLGRAPAPRATLPCVEWGEEWILPSGEIRPGVRSSQVWALGVQRR